MMRSLLRLVATKTRLRHSIYDSFLVKELIAKHDPLYTAKKQEGSSGTPSFCICDLKCPQTYSAYDTG